MTDPNAPVHFVPFDRGAHDETGLTKREHFAALAFQGLLSDPAVDNISEAAHAAVEYADFLIAALQEGQ